MIKYVDFDYCITNIVCKGILTNSLVPQNKLISK